MRRTSMPGVVIGKEKTVSPRCFSTSQLVRARQIAQSPYQPAVVQIFDPLRIQPIAVAYRGRDGAGCVGAAARLGQELDPDLLAAQHGRDMAQLLLLGAEFQQERPWPG